MFKKFNFEEDLGGRTPMKTSVQRNLKTKLAEWYPGIADNLDEILPKKSQITIVKTKEAITFLAIDGEFVFFNHFDGQWFPTLRLLHKYPDMLPKVQTDKGAIKFVVNGADIMCPGLTSKGARMDVSLPAETVVAVMAEGKEHAMAIGKMKLSTEEIKSVNKGIGIEMVHHLGDGLWTHSKKILSRGGSLAPPEFEPSYKVSPINELHVLVIGAGGLGCEILKNLALSGFKKIHVIDMDTIELSNLNRQFLFRPGDVGKSKAKVAAAFVLERVPNIEIKAHYAKIQDFDESFYRQFALIICGLDSIEARRWINATVYQMYDPSDPSSIIPIIDGGTEGLKGQSRIIIPGNTACYECSLDMFTKKVAYPLCTIANTPRLPEHCIEWASVLEWPKLKPDLKLDPDDPDHITWLFETASKRAKQFKISGVTYSLTQGVVKNIIPAIASTNAIIAASCCNEALKMVTSCAKTMNNYMMYTGEHGVYTYTFELEKKAECPVCGNEQLKMSVERGMLLEEFIDYFMDRPSTQLKNPSFRSSKKSLYMKAPPMLEESTRPNLKRKMGDLIDETDEIIVTDPSIPVMPPKKRKESEIKQEKPLNKSKYPYKINDPPTDRPVRVYCDGIYDLFHFGHARALEQAKKSFTNVYLLVGVCNDEVTHAKKGKTVMNAKERGESLRHCKWVDEVIENAPWVITQEFLDEHRIDFVAHDDIPYQSDGLADVYEFVKKQGKFYPTQRTDGISTSDLITRIVRDYDAYVRRNLDRGVSAKELNVGFIKKTEIQVKKQVEGINKIIRDKIKEGEGYIKQNWAESTEELRESVESSELLRGFLSLFGGEGSVKKLLGVTPSNENLDDEEPSKKKNKKK